MLVRCPSCKTTYKVADELVRGAPPAFRCSRCKHTFEIQTERADGKAAARPEPPQPATAPEELTFTFPAHESEPPPHAEQTKGEPPDAAEAASPEDPLRRSTGPAEAFPARDEPNAAPLAAAEDGDFPADDEPQAPERGPRGADNVLAFDPHRAQPASVVPYLTLFFLLIVAFGLLTAFHHVHPGSSEQLLKNIPFLGSSVLKNNHLKSGVDLQSLRAGYQTIQGPREVFVVTGVA
ncbi:MAG TPA: zinc-ribbon domain-containing protein, partial [Candidatus Eisenbacteria bacterium]|nr:zinc-ribbon domain-containing protein [Candidatus Eisenbacteria bacterium]